MNVLSLFPIPIGEIELTPLTEEEMGVIGSFEQTRNAGNTNSKNAYVLREPGMERLEKELTEKVNQFFRGVMKYEVELYITQSWTNYTEPGEFHHKHEHPNSIVSGVFYIQTSQDKIMFFRDKYSQILFKPSEWNSFNSETWWVEAKPNHVLFFPSSLAHSVPKTESSKTRISLAFNTFVRGKFGSYDELTELIL